MAKSKIGEVKALAESRYLSMYQVNYKNKIGEDKSWMVASRKTLDQVKANYFEEAEDNIDAVILFAKHVEEDKIVLVRQFRVPLNGFVYELPAGLVDPGESLESTVERELREETGLELVEIDYENSKLKTYVSCGMTDESVGMIHVKCRGEISDRYLEDDEELEAVLLSKDEAKKLIQSDEKIDIKALMAIQRFILE